MRLSVFSPSDLSSDINRFEISLSNKTKKSKDPDICKYFSVKHAYAFQHTGYFVWLLLLSRIVARELSKILGSPNCVGMFSMSGTGFPLMFL